MKYYNRTNSCDRIKKVGYSWRRCGKNFILGPGHPYKEYNEKGKYNEKGEYNEKGDWNGKWICFDCYYEERRKNPNDYHQLIKQLANNRTGNLDPNCNHAKGNNFEELTSRWRGVKRLSIENDKYSQLPLDHSKDPKLGVIQTKGARLTVSRSKHGILEYEYSVWSTRVINEHKKEFDYLIFYCANKDGTLIERIYIIPKSEIIKRSGITIYKSSRKGIQWYEKYRITEEEIIKKINEIWKEIIGGN